MGQTYKRIKDYVLEVNDQDGAVVEIGSSRPGDDQSSPYLRDLAKEIGKIFYTCDIDPAQATELLQQGINAHCYKGEDFLRSFAGKISIAYLDNFDWNWHPMNTEAWTKDQMVQYKEKFGLEMNNVNSQMTHLGQTILIEQLSTEKSIICFDDTWYDRGWDIYNGKGGASVPYLLSKGYKVLHTEEYGTILGRFG